MKIMLDVQFRPHDTCDSAAWRDLQRKGWRLTQLWLDGCDDPCNAWLKNGDVVHDIVVGWTRAVEPLRWAEVPDNL